LLTTQIDAEPFFIKKHLLTSSEVPGVPMYKGNEGKEVFAKHLLNTSSTI
jgi:hypothetical protein